MSTSKNNSFNGADNEREEGLSSAQSCAGGKPLCANVGNQLGATPSNTAPPKYTEGKYIHPLTFGIDSLYLSFQGQIKPSTEDILNALKDLAQSDKPEVSGLAFYEVFDHKFEVKPKGAGKFSFVLDDNWFNIQLSGSKSTNMPLAYIQVKSELLTFHDLDEIISDLVAIVDFLGIEVSSPTTSRLDLCMDFFCLNNFRIEDIRIEQWKTRAVQIDRFHQHKKPSGWRIGKGDMMARIYNKTLEIEKSKKDYLIDLWKEAGWNSFSDVWRVEFQFRRSFFSEISHKLLGVSFAEFIHILSPTLWQYGSSDWLQLVEVNPKDSNPSRWPLHPAWEEVIHSYAGDKPEHFKRVRKERIPDDDYLFVNGLGAISSFMAREGISDIGEAFGEFLKRAEFFHMKNRQGNLEEYLKQKAFEKTKRYNTTMKE